LSVAYLVGPVAGAGGGVVAPPIICKNIIGSKGMLVGAGAMLCGAGWTGAGAGAGWAGIGMNGNGIGDA